MKQHLKPEEKRGPIAWMAGHSVAANLAMLICLVGGFLMLRQIKQEVFPNITFDAVTVSVAYPGASPEEVESGVLLSIEEAIQGLEGIDEVTSVANEGSGSVTAELLNGVDVNKVTQDIKSEVDRITTFPEEAEEPEVRAASHKREVLEVVLYGDAPTSSLHMLGDRLRDQLLQDPNITQVDLTGVPPLEIAIEVPEDQLRRYNLTMQDVATRLRNAAVDVPGGALDTKRGEVLVRVKERRDYGRQFAQLPIITTADGSTVTLGDIATVKDGYADTDRYTLYNGKRAVILEVFRVGDQTPIQVSAAAKKQLEEFQPSLPAGVKATIEDDRSDVYRERVMLLLKNGALGLCLVLVSLGLFLEARLAFWVMMGIPISFLGSFLFLPATDITINMMSLFAYIIALGIVVDDAIVVGENVYHHYQEGLPFHAAAARGAREVAMPVVFSILTNIVAFMPIYFIPGIMGKVFSSIPIVVSLVFLISLGESLFVLPAHLGHQKKRRRHGISLWLHEKQQAFSHAFRHWIRYRYGGFLKFALHHRHLTLASALGILILMAAYAASGRLGFQLFPVVESDFSQAMVTLPYGSPVEKTEAIMRRIHAGAEQVIKESGHPELVKSIITEIGRGGSHTGQMEVNLADADIRDKVMSTEEFTRRWRQTVGEIPGADNMRFSADAGGPGSHGRPITVELSHRNIGVLEDVGTELANILSTYPLIKDVDDGFQPGKPQLDFTIKPEGKRLGLTARDVARQVRNSLYGAEALRQQRGRNEIKVMVRLPERERATEQTIKDMMIRTPAGTYVRLPDVASYDWGRAYKSIDRRNGRRVVQVTADITPRSKAGEVLADLRKEVMPKLIRNHPGLTYSFEGHQADIRESMSSLMVTFLIAMLAIYALLAIPFHSYVQPIIVMASIPFGVVGAFLGHMVMGYNLCVPSMFGIVALCGVVVNDSLVLIDFVNRIRKETDLSPFEAIHTVAIQRFRPVFLTTITTFAGLAPMIFETSRQARFLIPMALSLGYGILFATFITLVILPSLYLVIEDFRRAGAKVQDLVTTNDEPTPEPQPE